MFLQLRARKKGQELGGQGKIYVSVKLVGSVIVILCYLATSNRRMNLASENININPIYIKPKSWDVCRNFKESQNP